MTAYKFEKLRIINDIREKCDNPVYSTDVCDAGISLHKKPARLFFSSPCLMSEFEDEEY
jgi:hypothetical protein